MKKLIVASVLSVLTSASQAACQDLSFNAAAQELNRVKSPSTSLMPAPARTETGREENPKEWTIMVFMNGKSNIEPFALNDMNRFETVGSNADVNIVVEIGRSRGLDNDTQADGDWEGVRRYLVEKDQDKEKISSPVLADLGKADMGDYKEAVAFVKWARENFKAKKYMLIIWDHGWGWIDPKKPGKRPSGPSRSISHDFTTGNYIKTTELGKIFKEAGKVDVYASMACFMQMAEVAYEIKDGADIIVGSEEIIQLPSFNFEDFLALMLKNPQAGAQEAGVYLTGTFGEMYSRPEYQDMLDKSKYGTQLSAIRAAELPEFAKKLKKWAELARTVNDVNALKKAKKEVLRFEVGDETTDPDKEISFYGDLFHFVDIVGKNTDMSRPGAKQLGEAGEHLKKFITETLTIKNVYVGKDRTGKSYAEAHGIGIHIPGKPGSLIEYYDVYPELAFEKSSSWRRFTEYLEGVN